MVSQDTKGNAGAAMSLAKRAAVLLPEIEALGSVDPFYHRYLEFVERTIVAVEATPLGDDALSYALDHADIDPHGIWVEFGVYSGTSLATIAQAATEQVGHGKVVHGFDSFRGQSKSPLATDNLLESTDGGGAPHQCSLGAALCCFLFMLTRALH